MYQGPSDDGHEDADGCLDEFHAPSVAEDGRADNQPFGLGKSSDNQHSTPTHFQNAIERSRNDLNRDK